jgi:hypothetical protein
MSAGFLSGRSSVLGAMGWMFGLSLVLSLLLWWVPVVGPFIGPAVGGFVGGRRAGTAGRALGAAILPALLLSALIFLAGVAGAALSHTPVLGAVGALVAGAAGIVLFFHNLLLIGAALVGGFISQSEDGR